MSIDWKVSPSDLAEALMGMYHNRARAAVASLAIYFGAKMEAYAKQNAPWQDRTGNARQTLFSLAVLGPDQVALYLSHGVSYGKWLELCNQGRYAIIMPAMQVHYQEMMAALRALFA
jgi:hypothetical protein